MLQHVATGYQIRLVGGILRRVEIAHDGDVSCPLALLLSWHITGIESRPPIPPHRPRPPRMTPAAVKDVNLRVTINDQVARTEVEEIFVNPNPQPLEGTFVLPIPADAQISNFTFFIDGKEVKGEILPREKAQRYYRDIVARLIDPALLEYMDKGLIRVKMFPIPPRGEAKIRFAYTQILRSEGEQLTYYYPFGTNKFSSKPLSQAVVDVSPVSPEDVLPPEESPQNRQPRVDDGQAEDHYRYGHRHDGLGLLGLLNF